LDLIDKGILHELNRNCRRTFQELSQKFGISANAIRRRVLKLEETGAISAYLLRFSRDMVDCDLLFGLLWSDGSKDEIEFVDLIGESRFIIAAASYTNSTYALLAEYITPSHLLEVGSYLRSLPGIEKVEIHPVITRKGDKIELNSLHLRVLNCLVDDPRMTIVDIAHKTGLTARRVRKIVQNMVESSAINFTIGYELGQEEIPFILRISWEETLFDHEKIKSWLEDTFGPLIWELWISAIEPTVFVLFSVENVNEIDSIAREVRHQEFVKTVKTLIGKHHKYFGGLTFDRIYEVLRDGGYR
jgi:DNA-binding Lrp family transcriptional regulator